MTNQLQSILQVPPYLYDEEPSLTIYGHGCERTKKRHSVDEKQFPQYFHLKQHFREQYASGIDVRCITDEMKKLAIIDVMLRVRGLTGLIVGETVVDLYASSIHAPVYDQDPKVLILQPHTMAHPRPNQYGIDWYTKSEIGTTNGKDFLQFDVLRAEGFLNSYSDKEIERANNARIDDCLDFIKDEGASGPTFLAGEAHDSLLYHRGWLPGLFIPPVSISPKIINKSYETVEDTISYIRLQAIGRNCKWEYDIKHLHNMGGSELEVDAHMKTVKSASVVHSFPVMPEEAVSIQHN